MIAPGIPFDDIGEPDLRSLLENAVAERRTIEYKRELPGGGDEARKEFLADISSFANANAGDLIFGIDAADGVPTEITPLEINPDQERLRWEQAIRSGIDPRIPSVRAREVPVEGGHLLLIRVPRSFVGPHAVTYRGSFRFFARTSAGKYPLDVGELRSAFLAASGLSEQIRNFRVDRLGQIMAGDEPIPLPPANPKIVLHLIPLDAFSTEQPLELRAQEGSGLFRPVFRTGGGLYTRWNIDGLLTYDTDREEQRVTVYSQLFRNGIFEGVDALALEGRPHPNIEGSYLYAQWLEIPLNTGVGNPLAVLQRIGVEPPIAVLVAVVGAHNYLMLSGQTLWDTRGGWHRIDRDVLLLPDILLEEYPSAAEIPRLMRPIVDAFWQSGGWDRSPYYDADGNWTQPR